jgi:hypothetical protein
LPASCCSEDAPRTSSVVDVSTSGTLHLHARDRRCEFRRDRNTDRRDAGAQGLGGAILPLATLPIIVTVDVDRADAGLASGMWKTSRQVGGSFSLAIFGAVAADRTANFVNLHSSEALVSRGQRAFQISVVITLLVPCVPRRVGVAEAR